MKKQQKYSGFMGVLAVQAVLAGTAGAEPAVDEAARVRWLQENAAPLRSIAPADEDFSDLGPLQEAIGDARVVLLGEQTHGDGATFLAKARLIRFLHQRMGFDVIAFESGLYDCARAWQFMRAGEQPRTAFQRGVFGIWADSAQVQPLIDYMGRMARSERPLELAGFDSQFTASASEKLLVPDLQSFLDARGIDTAELPDWENGRALLAELVGNRYIFEKPAADKQAALLALIDAISVRVRSLPAGGKGPFDKSFWVQMLQSMAAQARYLFVRNPHLPDESTANNNRRDLQMGENLLWLAQQRYPHRKIVVWAATYHNIRNVRTVENPGHPGVYAGMASMGDVVWEAMGRATYNIGFIASEGLNGFVGQEQPSVLAPPAPGSLEALLAATTYKNAFLDLRRPPAGGKWLHEPLLTGPMGYVPMRADWAQVLDGLVYTRRMEPSRAVAGD